MIRKRSASNNGVHKPGPMFGPMDFGIADDGERTGREQATQIAVPSFADVAKVLDCHEWKVLDLVPLSFVRDAGKPFAQTFRLPDIFRLEFAFPCEKGIATPIRAGCP